MGKYWISLKMGFMNSLEYRVDFLFTLLTAFFPIVIQLFMWINVFARGEALVFGYTFNQLICYAILSNFVASLIHTNVYTSVSDDIKRGNLNAYLTKPVNYIAFRSFDVFGGKITEFLLVGLLGAGAIWFLMTSANLGVAPISLVLFVISLALSFLLNYFIYLCFSFLAFWITENRMLFGAFRVTISVIGGSVFPLDIFGDWFTQLSKALPFQNLVYVPLNIIMGKLEPQQAGSALVVQAAWFLAFALLAGLLWKRGIKRYMGVGG